MNFWDRKRFEQLDAWTVSLRPTLLNIMDGSNQLSWGELFCVCREKSAKLSSQFRGLYRSHHSYVAALLFVGLQNLLMQHIQSSNLRERLFVNMDQFKMLWDEYMRKIEIIKDILWPAKPIELHADLIRIFMRQICDLEAMEKNDKFRHASLNFRLDNLQLGQLYNIEVVQNFLERCGINLNNAPSTLSDLCIRRICSDLNVDALQIPSIVKQKICAELEYWPMPPWGIGSRKEKTEMTSSSQMSSSKGGKEMSKMFYEEFVVVAQNEVKLEIEDGVVFTVSTEVGAYTIKLEKTNGHIEVRIWEFMQGRSGDEKFEIYAYAYTKDPDKLQDPENRAQILSRYANLPANHDALLAIQPGRHQLFGLNFANIQPEEPIRNDLSVNFPGWKIDINENKEVKMQLTHFVFTIRMLKARKDFTDFKITSTLRTTEIFVNSKPNSKPFYVNEQFLICWTSDHESSQPAQQQPQPANYFQDIFDDRNRPDPLRIDVEGCCLPLREIKESALPSAESIFEDFLLCLTHPVLPNRDNVFGIWLLADRLNTSDRIRIIEKCKETVKLAREMDYHERAYLAGYYMRMPDSFLAAINSNYIQTNSASKVVDGLGKFVKRPRNE